MENIPIRKLQKNSNEPGMSDRFTIRELGEMNSGKDMVQELHRHDFFYLLLVQKGAGLHTIDFVPHTISDRTVFFMRPGQVHEVLLKAGSSGFLIQFTKDFYFPQNKISNQWVRKAGASSFCQLDQEAFSKLLISVKAILQEHSDQQEGFEGVIKAMLEIFFIELVRLRKTTQGNVSSTNLYAQELLEKLLELLESNIVSEKQVSYYADKLNLSAYQLNAITKASLGKTCSQVINDCILLEAKRYLLATSNQVNQIAYSLGYDDTSYFIRFFKKHTGLAPEAFRTKFK